MHPLINRQPDETFVDHVTLGAPDIEEGRDYVEPLAGVCPFADEAFSGAHTPVRERPALPEENGRKQTGRGR